MLIMLTCDHIILAQPYPLPSDFVRGGMRPHNPHPEDGVMIFPTCPRRLFRGYHQRTTALQKMSIPKLFLNSCDAFFGCCIPWLRIFINYNQPATTLFCTESPVPPPQLVAQLKELAVITVPNLAVHNCNECLIFRLTQF